MKVQDIYDVWFYALDRENLSTQSQSSQTSLP